MLQIRREFYSGSPTHSQGRWLPQGCVPKSGAVKILASPKLAWKRVLRSEHSLEASLTLNLRFEQEGVCRESRMGRSQQWEKLVAAGATLIWRQSSPGSWPATSLTGGTTSLKVDLWEFTIDLAVNACWITSGVDQTTGWTRSKSTGIV